MFSGFVDGTCFVRDQADSTEVRKENQIHRNDDD